MIEHTKEPLNKVIEINTSSNSLSDFILQDLIGRGSFGKVYRAKDKHTKEIYAAKISIKAIEDDMQDLFREISQEVNIISKLNHPSVLKFIFYSPVNFKQKTKPVIITEYASNGSLLEHIEHDRIHRDNPFLNDTSKLIIIFGIVSAMSYLHSHDILHRDLKPDNILLDDFLFPKIADFGLSKSSILQENIALQTAAGILKGTPMFMAPEIWSKGAYSKSSDVYAFSIVLYQIMTLRKPFPNVDIFSLGLRVKNGGRPDINVEIPEAYKDLIVRCWSQDPNSRPMFDQILIELRTNHKFITENVDEAKYIDYIRYIDEYKTSFDLDKNVVQMTTFHQFKKKFLNRNMNRMKVNENQETLFKYAEKIEEGCCIVFPYKYYQNLNEKSQQLVDDAVNENENENEKLFEIGRNLIEGRLDFPIDVKVGLDFIKKSMNKGHRSSLIYFINMLIKGEFIPSNHNKVRKLLDKFLSSDKSTYFLIEGKLLKNEKRYSESAECFKQSIKLGNIDSLYEYAELQRKSFYQPEMKEDINDYYKKAINKGHLKSMYRYGIQLLQNENESEKEEGKKLIKTAADNGYKKASYYYGQIIERENEKENIQLQPEESESMKYYKKGADEGYVESMNKYGIRLFKYNQRLQRKGNYEECIKYFKKAMYKGCIESMFQYGFILTYYDDGSAQKEKEGTRFFKISAEEGFPDAMGEYASSLHLGRGIDVDNEEAVKYYKKGIEKGSAIAMNDYALMLKLGQGVEVNYKEAIKYYKMAIDKGLLPAISNYAYMLQSGQGTEINYKEAIKYYKMAIDKGHPQSMSSYGYMLENGQGTEINYKEAIKYYKMAIDKGNLLGMCYYGNMLEYGRGVEVNYEEAIKYYKIGISRGFPIAFFNYGNMLECGRGVEVNIEEAIKYYKMAIDKGNSNAMNCYGNMLENGRGVEINYDEAIKYYKMAIDKVNFNGTFFYANMLEHGKGLEANLDEANKMYKMAADNGSLKALAAYAKNLYYGNGLIANKKEAIDLLKNAVFRKESLVMLYYGLILCEQNEIEEGVPLIKESADIGNLDAMFEYGRLFEEGKIKNVDKSEIIKLYEKAAKIDKKKGEEALQRIRNMNE